MELDWTPSLGWMILFVAAFAAIIVVCVNARSSHFWYKNCDLLQYKKISHVSPMLHPRLWIIAKTRLRMGNADDEGDHSFLFV
ncbi:hypothetical protein ACFO25_02630 [Paenactinomyces guangxiensis]|uniref:Uncharacterized protein n=1 Tax=Paenactinomyces guangxiensis TaxID=1490290 RepID=A0A7W1WTG6_9BACL|nr:hypothetical protein [Paenactinomyces guangxiensis]MBA4495536.1 hypothetical protein [Paenactinomyces guangxiensis]MBH8592794.1 hypothetical protein [Paenactinomyces guangxiensis]